METAKIREGFMIFAASPADDVAIDAAKKYITDNALTQDDVKLGRIENTAVVITKKEVELLQ